MTEYRSKPPRRPPTGRGTGESTNPWQAARGPAAPRTPRDPARSTPYRDADHRDASHRDAGHRDAGQRGPGHRDAGHGDAGHGDAGHHRDARYRDAGHRDAGHRHAGQHEQGRRDRGPHDEAASGPLHRGAPPPRGGAHRPAPRGAARPHDQHGNPWFDDSRLGHGAHDEAGQESQHPARAHRQAELRLYGLNAINAVFTRRPQAIRKLYLLESRIPAVQPLLKWCVAHRVGYRIAEEGDLDRLAASTHHEGLVADVLRDEPQSLSPWLRDLPVGPHCALWLDGVGNPHNFGAILRSAAHFGASAILLPKHSPLALSGAAARVAEGGAEVVPLVRLGRTDNAIAQLRGTGFTLAATLVQGGRDVFEADMPERLVYVIGAEGEGMDRELAQACDLRVSIPGSGTVESLNVAAATAVLLARWKHR